MLSNQKFISQQQLRRIIQHLAPTQPKALQLIYGSLSDVDDTITVGPLPHEKSGTEGMYEAEMVEVFDDALVVYASEKLKTTPRSISLRLSEDEFVQGVVDTMKAALDDSSQAESHLHVHLNPPMADRNVPSLFLAEREDIARDELETFVRDQALEYFRTFAVPPEIRARGL